MTSPLSETPVDPSALTVLTRTQPTANQREDVAFALPIVNRIRQLDVGHSLAIKEREIIAVEAAEGATAMIHRAGDLCRHGKWTLMLFATASGDALKLDAKLIEQMKPAGVVCIGVEATLLPQGEKSPFIEAADAARISVIRYSVE